MQEILTDLSTSNPRALNGILAGYRVPVISRSVVELLITAAGFVLFWALMAAALRSTMGSSFSSPFRPPAS